MLWSIFLIVILAVVATCDDDNTCDTKYVTINTFETRRRFSVACYGIQSDCDIYYSPPGAGCDENSLTFVGRIPANKTQVLSSEFVFGGAFCSKDQIGVFHRDDEFDILSAQLPGPPDAGTKFRAKIAFNNEVVPYECAIFGLSLPAKITLSIDDNEQTVNVSRFENYQFSFNVMESGGRVIKAISDNPIIISCISEPSGKLMVTFVPISWEPIFMIVKSSDQVSLMLSDCSTNELITDFTRVKISIGGYNNNCQYSIQNFDDVQVIAMSRCVMYVESEDDQVCMSATKEVESKALGEMAIPESWLSTRVTDNIFEFSASIFYSFTEATCTVDPLQTSSTWPPLFRLFWIEDNLNLKVSSVVLENRLNEINSITCSSPLLFVYNGGFGTQAFVSTYREKEFWRPYFVTECSIPDITRNPISPIFRNPGDRSKASSLIFLGFSILSVSFI